MARPINLIILHHSASGWGDATIIDRWHKERGFSKIGYHFVILNGRRTGNGYREVDDGFLECGRSLDEIGAHCKGYNRTSLGICLIGYGFFTFWQYHTLSDLLKTLLYQLSLPIDSIKGHKELDPRNKPKCPGFDVDRLRNSLSKNDQTLSLIPSGL